VRTFQIRKEYKVLIIKERTKQKSPEQEPYPITGLPGVIKIHFFLWFLIYSKETREEEKVKNAKVKSPPGRG
jgi:hypothetical protein